MAIYCLALAYTSTSNVEFESSSGSEEGIVRLALESLRGKVNARRKYMEEMGIFPLGTQMQRRDAMQQAVIAVAFSTLHACHRDYNSPKLRV